MISSVNVIKEQRDADGDEYAATHVVWFLQFVADLFVYFAHFHVQKWYSNATHCYAVMLSCFNKVMLEIYVDLYPVKD